MAGRLHVRYRGTCSTVSLGWSLRRDLTRGDHVRNIGVDELEWPLVGCNIAQHGSNGSDDDQDNPVEGIAEEQTQGEALASQLLCETHTRIPHFIIWGHSFKEGKGKGSRG